MRTKKTQWHMWDPQRRKATAPTGFNASAIGKVCGKVVSPLESAWNSKPCNRRSLSRKTAPPTPGRFLGLSLSPAGSKKGAAWRSHFRDRNPGLVSNPTKGQTNEGPKNAPPFLQDFRLWRRSRALMLVTGHSSLAMVELLAHPAASREDYSQAELGRDCGEDVLLSSCRLDLQACAWTWQLQVAPGASSLPCKATVVLVSHSFFVR